MIFFDIDGTLIDHASASAAASLRFYDQFADEIASPRAEFPEVWEDILMKHFNRFCRGELSVWEQRRERMREVFANPGMNEQECDRRYRIFMAEYEPATQAYPDALPALEKVRDCELGIISNGVREQQITKLERAGMSHFFRVMVFSEDAGLGKPDPGIFLEACRRAKKEPAECVYIGDNLETDILPSRALGMRSVWVERTAAVADYEDVPVIFSLTALPSALGRALESTRVPNK
jgi:putative hydrolase of the HAD superfamily